MSQQFCLWLSVYNVWNNEKVVENIKNSCKCVRGKDMVDWQWLILILLQKKEWKDEWKDNLEISEYTLSIHKIELICTVWS